MALVSVRLLVQILARLNSLLFALTVAARICNICVSNFVNFSDSVNECCSSDLRMYIECNKQNDETNYDSQIQYYPEYKASSPPPPIEDRGLNIFGPLRINMKKVIVRNSKC